MRPNNLLTITSLLSILLITLHFTDDIVRGISPAGLENLIGVAIVVVWLYGTLVLRERMSGHIIMLLGSIFAAGMPVIHMRGAGFGEIVRSNGGFFFFWTVFALGVTGVFGIILAARGLWSLVRAKRSE